MRQLSKKYFALYALVATLSVGAAFVIAVQLLGHLQAQDEGLADDGMMPPPQQAVPASPPPSGSVPPQPAAQVPPSSSPPLPPPQVPPNVPAQNSPPGAAHPPGSLPPPSIPGVMGTPISQGGKTELSELEGFLEPFIYDIVNRRDPFMAYAEFTQKDSTSAPVVPLTPAQRYDLDQLRLVGIMWDIKDPKAMFMDPNSEVLVLGRDEGIGNRNGYIASIREGEVVVVEAIRKRNDILYKTRVLRIER